MASWELDGGGHRGDWPSAAQPSGLVAWAGGAGTGHGIDVERLFDHVGGVGGIVPGYLVLDAADAVIWRAGRGDDALERRKVVGESAGEVVG